LTSASTKLRGFPAPIHHLLLTILYTEQPGFALMDGLRLDFLEPDSLVSIRLEASVSHQLLAQGGHRSRHIG
jgi:hypothetical protein